MTELKTSGMCQGRLVRSDAPIRYLQLGRTTLIQSSGLRCGWSNGHGKIRRPAAIIRQMATPLEMIRFHGDFLEQGMFADWDFACSFHTYPILWRALVLPNRDPAQPTFTIPKWRNFSAHHYSAIIRCWNACRASHRIMSVCYEAIENPRAGDLYLELQEHYVSFFSAVGAAYDNLQAVFNDAQVDAARAWDQKVGSSSTHGSLRWFYERRTQAVHKIIIPFFEANGLPHFDRSAFRDPDVRWDEYDCTNMYCVAEAMSSLSDKFIHEVGGAWAMLLGILKERHVRAFQKSVDEDSVIEAPMHCGSGTGPGWAPRPRHD